MEPHLVAFVNNKVVCYYKDGSQEIFMDGSPEYRRLRISSSRSWPEYMIWQPTITHGASQLTDID